MTAASIRWHGFHGNRPSRLLLLLLLLTVRFCLPFVLRVLICDYSTGYNLPSKTAFYFLFLFVASGISLSEPKHSHDVIHSPFFLIPVSTITYSSNSFNVWFEWVKLYNFLQERM